MSTGTAIFGTIMVVVSFALGFFRGYSVGVTDTERLWSEAVDRADANRREGRP